MAKTIKQIADEMGVSKQTIRDKIAKLGLQSSLQKNGNQLCVSEQHETLIKSAFIQNKPQSETAKIDDIYLQQMQSEISFFREQNKSLQEELTTERQHSRELSDKLVQLADQAQRLQLAQFNTNEPLKLLQEQNESTREKKTKQSFLNRIFQKSKEIPP